MSSSGAENDFDNYADDADNGPGATTLWFGKHSGIRLDKVVKEELGYAEWCRHPNQKRFRWYIDFCRLYEDYEDWVEENEGPINPGNAVVWFGQRYKGNPFSAAYSAPGYIRALLDDNDNKRYAWYYWLCRQKKKMDAWRKTHRRGSRLRGPSDKIRDIGEIVGRRDDGFADPDDEYEKDGFIVSDSDDAEDDDIEGVIASAASTQQSRASHGAVESRRDASSEGVGWETRGHTTQELTSRANSLEDEQEREEETSSSDYESEGWLSIDADEFDDDAEYSDDESELLDDSPEVSSPHYGQDEDPPPPTRMRTRSSTAQKCQPEQTSKGEETEVDSEEEVEALTIEAGEETEADSRRRRSQSMSRRKRTVSYANLSDHDDRPTRRLHRRPRNVYEDHPASDAESDAEEDSDPGPRPSVRHKSSYGKLDFSDDDMYQISHASSSRPASAPTTPRR